MASLRLGGKRADPKPDRRLGIKLADPTEPRHRLGGKLTAYVPPGAQYDYKTSSVFARYKVLTTVFVVLSAALFAYWVYILRQPASAIPPGPVAQPPAQESQPIYIEPLAPR